MINKSQKIFEDRIFLLLNELRGKGVNFVSYGPIILALLTLRYAEIKNKQSALQNDTTPQLDEAINVLKLLWPYDKNLLSKFLENTINASFLKPRREFPEELIATLQALNSIPFENFNDQLEIVFGDVFEYLLFQLSEMGGKTGAGAYTPRTIVSLMTEILKPQSGEAIYDPTCGSGGFLLSAWNYVQKHDGGNSLTLYGQDVNLTTSCIARMNMIVHGITTTKIVNENALVAGNAWQLGNFDVVMANPPFSVKSWRQDWASDSAAAEVFKFGLPPKSNADYAFIQHVIYSMKRNGRAAMIVASGVLFRGGIESAIRTKLVEEKYIETVIALPSNIFYGTAIAAYLLLLKGGRSENDILFVDATKDYKIAEGRNVFDALAIQETVDTCKTRTSEIGKSRLVSFEEIQANSFNLEVSRYVQEARKEESTHLAELVEKQKILESRLQVLQNCMHQYF